MTVVRCYNILKLWKYYPGYAALHAFSFSKFHFLSSTAQVFQIQSTNKEALDSPKQEFDSHMIAQKLHQCLRMNEPTKGKILHCQILKIGNCLDLFAQNILLNLYMKTEYFSDGVRLFEEMLDRNVVSFVTMIQGHLQLEEYDKAVELFLRLCKEGHELNPFVFTTTLKLFVSLNWVEFVWCLHASIHKLGHDSNVFVGTSLIDAYSTFGLVTAAEKVFHGISDKDMISWTGMVACYADNKCFEEALYHLKKMRMEGLVPNNFAFASAIKACVGLEAIAEGNSIHGCILKTRYEMDPYVSVSLLDLYTGSGDIKDARKVFEEIPKDDVVSWSFMIARYSQSDHYEEALDLFLRMWKALVIPNQFTLASVLQACAKSGHLDFGTQIHCHVCKVGFDLNIFVLNALMDVYAKCRNMEAALKLFMECEIKNDVSWNTMIVGHVHLGDAEKAFQMYLDMHDEQFKATEVTYSCLLCASASMAALDVGIQIHAMTIKTLYDVDDSVCNALIDMYAKCGRIVDARTVFDGMSKRGIVSWNAIISAYSMHGLGTEALRVFENMQGIGIKPNQLTFVAVLSACSNSGALDQGQAYFTSMQQEYGIEPCMEHYTCMVSLLGRLGRLEMALKIIEELPNEPSVMIWRALLGVCVAHKNLELGRVVAERVLEMDPHGESSYVLLSNLYATAKRWDHVKFIRKRMKNKGVKKEPGLSWVENSGIVHYFAVGDDSHPDMKLIQGMLEWLNFRSNAAGYAPNCDIILHDVEEDEKTRLLWLHSERIALAYALVRMPRGSPIRIIKNLRICADCHAVIKFVSELVKREIIVRDINRFHHFQDGVCSCNDFW